MGTKYGKTRAMWTNEEFKQLTLEFRVAAVMSDGQFYTADKVRTMCMEKPEVSVKPYLDAMVSRGELTKHSNGVSYYMTLKQMWDWRDKNDVPRDAQIIPRIVAPRVFGAAGSEETENEMFLNAPLHQLGTVSFTLVDPFMLDDLRCQLGWMGKFKVEGDEGRRCKLYCLSATTARQRLLRFEEEHGGNVFAPGKCTSHNRSMRRELCEIDHEAMSELTAYYIPFSKILVPYIVKTFDTYMGSGPGNKNDKTKDPDVQAEGDTIIMGWIVSLIQRYNAESGFPFSAYLKSSLPNMVYDYSATQIGSKENKFQIEKNRAIKRLNEANGTPSASVYYSPETIRKDMAKHDYRLTREQYKEYDSTLDSWRKARKPTASLDWDDGEEKKFGAGYDPAQHDDPFDDKLVEQLESASRVQRAILVAGSKTGEQLSSVRTLRLLTDSRSLAAILMSGVGLDLSDEFKDTLAGELSRSV